MKNYINFLKEDYFYNDDSEFDEEEYSLDLDTIELDGIYYHGTSLDKDDDFFQDFELGHSDWEAVWFSDNENIAEDFGDNWGNDDNVVIIYLVEIKSNDIVNISLDTFEEIKDFYGYEDLRESIPILAQEYDGWKTLGSIGSNIYDDIAIFNTKCIRIKQAKIQINDEWSEYMSLSEIEEKFNKWKDEEL